MDPIDLQRIIKEGENSRVQFKQMIGNRSGDDLSAELVAMSNADGGTLIIGVEDKTGSITGLSYVELEEYNNLLFNWSTNNVKPATSIFTETQTINGKQVLVAKIPKGFDKPYCDKNMVYWVKSAANKRRVSPEELKRLFQASGKIYAERAPLYQTSLNDLDLKLFTGFSEKKYNEPIFMAISKNSMKEASLLSARPLIISKKGGVLTHLESRKYLCLSSKNC